MTKPLTYRLSFYIICLLLYTSTVIFTYLLYGFDIKSLIYLSNINLYSNLIYTSLMFYSCVIHPNHFITIDKIQNYFYKFNFCFSFTVLCIYWAIVSIDVNLVLKRSIPIALDLFLHGGIFCLLLFEHYFISRKRFTKKIGLKFFIYFYIAYSFTLFNIYYLFGVTLYPLINQIDLIEYFILTLISFFISAISTLIYKVLIEINIWSDEDNQFYYERLDNH